MGAFLFGELEPAISSNLVWDTLSARAEEAYSAGNYEEAERILRSSLQEVEQTDLGQIAARNSVTLQNIAFILFMDYKLGEAEETYERALPFTETAWGKDSMEFANNLHCLVRSKRKRGQFAEVDPVMRKILAIRTSRLGPDHKLVGNSLLDLAINCERLNKLTESLLFFDQAIAVKEKQFGVDSRDLVPYLESYRRALQKSNDIERLSLVESRINRLILMPRTETKKPVESAPLELNVDQRFGFLRISNDGHRMLFCPLPRPDLARPEPARLESLVPEPSTAEPSSAQLSSQVN